MNAHGFQITYLTLKGTGQPDATVLFGPGLNVISGPSDTGKTFICECIDYAFGASTKPSDIPEALNYESVILGLKELSSNVNYQLQRSLRGGSALVSSTGQADRTLAEKHQPGNQDTISSFLLTLCGLSGRHVRTNAQGKIREISFRDLAQLIIVSEQEIIRKHSPVRSGQNTERTVEDSVFRLLVSGVDDSSIVPIPDKAAIAAESKGKEELIDLLVMQSQVRLQEVAPGKTELELAEQLQKIDANIAGVMTSIAAGQQDASNLEDQRKNLWTTLKENQSRLSVLSELQERFSLLKAQYASDIRRLESIAEAGVRLGQLEQSRCPICGAESKFHAQQHPDQVDEPSVIAQSCEAEVSRLNTLVLDLDQTIAQNAEEVDRLTQDVYSLRKGMQAADTDLTKHFKPRLEEMIRNLHEAQGWQARIRESLDLHRRISELNNLRAQIVDPSAASPKTKFTSTASAVQTEELALKIERLLQEWQFPDLQRVTFSEVDQDIMISGRKRSDHGKGVRAITHAGFTIGLMYYCLDKHMPHSGVVVIDSPLVVYREPDTDEAGFSRALKDLVYSSLASQKDRGQVILLENEDPPTTLPDSATIIRFTGAAHGRKGFIPVTLAQVVP